jgi:hypothetical protein
LFSPPRPLKVHELRADVVARTKREVWDTLIRSAA